MGRTARVQWAPLVPYGFALLGIAIMGWTSRRLGGTWAAAITVTALFCASPLLLENLMAGTVHGMSW
jgi:hypothetical protein